MIKLKDIYLLVEAEQQQMAFPQAQQGGMPTQQSMMTPTQPQDPNQMTPLTRR